MAPMLHCSFQLSLSSWRNQPRMCQELSVLCLARTSQRPTSPHFPQCSGGVVGRPPTPNVNLETPHHGRDGRCCHSSFAALFYKFLQILPFHFAFDISGHNQDHSIPFTHEALLCLLPVLKLRCALLGRRSPPPQPPLPPHRLQPSRLSLHLSPYIQPEHPEPAIYDTHTH